MEGIMEEYGETSHVSDTDTGTDGEVGEQGKTTEVEKDRGKDEIRRSVRIASKYENSALAKALRNIKAEPTKQDSNSEIGGKETEVEKIDKEGEGTINRENKGWEMLGEVLKSQQGQMDKLSKMIRGIKRSREESSEDSKDSSDESENENEEAAMHVSKITGGDKHAGVYTPCSLPLGSFINSKIKQKIWNNKYIDFIKLLDKEARPAKGSISLEIKGGRVQKAKENKESLQNFKLWDEAFQVFMAIHASNPTPKVEIGEIINRLICYRKTIQEMANQGHDWAKYDRKFRMYLEGQGDPAFNIRVMDLYEQCRKSNWGGNNNTEYKNRNRWEGNTQFKKGEALCYRYQEGECTYKSCKFTHKCRVCLQFGHGSNRCPKKGRRFTANTSEGRDTK